MDCGKEFAGHAEFAVALGARVRIALPRRSWRQGGNESTNGLACDYFPKGTDFARVGDNRVTVVCDAPVTHAPQVPPDQEVPGDSLLRGAALAPRIQVVMSAWFSMFLISIEYTPAYGYTLGKGGEGSLDEGSRYG